MAMQIALLILTLAAPVVYGAQHIVGDSTGWSQGVDYSTWATGKTFTVGDTLCKCFLFRSHPNRDSDFLFFFSFSKKL
jgi:hypothetical protein